LSARAEKIAVIGAGSWGTALAVQLARGGNPVALWGHLPGEMEQLARRRRNERYLPGIDFPPLLLPEADLHAALAGAVEILVVVPSHAFRGVLRQLKPLLDENAGLSWATKGLEPGSSKLLHEVAAEEFAQPARLAVLSGPTFAMEVARGLPTAIAVASSDPRRAAQLARRVHAETFRAYISDDVIGVEIGGASKNVMAIAAGIADGLGFGANTRAALITRGLAEIRRLGLALGAKGDTFTGLTGIGDLALTCTDDQSRNRRFGLALARGDGVAAAREAIGQEVEGFAASLAVYQKARALGVEMPITEQVYKVLYESIDPRAAVHALLSREQKVEN